MSWDYHIAADAWRSIRALDVEVQEVPLDDLELLCETAEERGLEGEVLEQIYPVVNGWMHPLLLDLLVNRQRRLINLLEVIG